MVERPSGSESTLFEKIAEFIQELIDKITGRTREDLSQLRDDVESGNSTAEEVVAEAEAIAETAEVEGDLANLDRAFIFGASHSVGVNQHAPHGIGWGGNPTSRFLSELPAILSSIEQDEPQITHVVMMGTVNNVWGSDDPSRIDRAIEDYEEMVDMITGAGKTPVITTVINITGEDPEKVARVQALNERIREFAARERVTLVDLEHQYTTRGLHPGSSGYREMAEHISSAVS